MCSGQEAEVGGGGGRTGAAHGSVAKALQPSRRLQATGLYSLGPTAVTDYFWVTQNSFHPLFHVLLGRDGEGSCIQPHTQIGSDEVFYHFLPILIPIPRGRGEKGGSSCVGLCCPLGLNHDNNCPSCSCKEPTLAIFTFYNQASQGNFLLS